MHWCEARDGNSTANGSCEFVTAAGAFLCIAATGQGIWHLRRIYLLQRFDYHPDAVNRGPFLS